MNMNIDERLSGIESRLEALESLQKSNLRISANENSSMQARIHEVNKQVDSLAQMHSKINKYLVSRLFLESSDSKCDSASWGSDEFPTAANAISRLHKRLSLTMRIPLMSSEIEDMPVNELTLLMSILNLNILSDVSLKDKRNLCKEKQENFVLEDFLTKELGV